jgi:hypothetical protein
MHRSVGGNAGECALGTFNPSRIYHQTQGTVLAALNDVPNVPTALGPECKFTLTPMAREEAF